MPIVKKISFICKATTFFCFGILFLFSCKLPKDIKKPYIVKNEIKIESNLSIKNSLYNTLASLIDDSLTVEKKFLGLFLNTKKLKYIDSARIEHIIALQIQALQAEGFFEAEGYYKVILKKRKPYEAIIQYIFKPNKLFIIDSVSYAFDSIFSQQALRAINKKSPFVITGGAFNITNVESEMGRIVTIFRNHGYAQFSRSDISVEIDTTEPKKKITRLFSIFKIKHYPNRQRFRYLNIQFNNNRLEDSSHFIAYRIASITINTNTQKPAKGIISYKNIYLINNDSIYKNKFLLNQLILPSSPAYNQHMVNNTQATFSNIGNWGNVSVHQRYNADSTIDLYYEMIPAKRYGFGFNFEVARNVSDVAIFSSFFGIYTSANFLVRNLFKRGIQYKVTGSYGIDLGGQNSKLITIQTNQFGVSNTLRFPKLYIPYRNYFTTITEAYNYLVLDANYIERPTYYRVLNFRLNFSYNWNWKGYQFQVIPLNIESYNFTPYAQYETLISKNINYKNLYNNGTILSIKANMLKKWVLPQFDHILFLSIEESNLWGLLGSKVLPISNLVHFIQLQAEWRAHLQATLNTTWAFRLSLGNNILSNNTQTPFFRKFYEGGPNSMRAWLVRGLGPGSVVYPVEEQIIDRVGDFKIEANIEYRFNIIKIKTFKIESTLFIDAGNVWTKQPALSTPEGTKSVFRFATFLPQIAIASGTGIRLNYNNYFVLRLDWAYKIKDPVNGWISTFRLIRDGTLQFGIGYPF